MRLTAVHPNERGDCVSVCRVNGSCAGGGRAQFFIEDYMARNAFVRLPLLAAFVVSSSDAQVVGPSAASVGTSLPSRHAKHSAGS